MRPIAVTLGSSLLSFRPGRVLLPLCLALFAAQSAGAAPFDQSWRVLRHDPHILTADLARLESLAATHRSATQDAPREAVIVAWVFFADKGVRSDGEFAAARRVASDHLTPAGLARREVLGGAYKVDYLDLPVRADYIQQVVKTGARVRHPSRWLNAVSVEATSAELHRIADLPEVSRLMPVARSRRAPLPKTPPSTAVATAGAHLLNYGPSESQLDEIQVTTAHDLGFSGAGVIVAMLDTGYFKDHETFAAIRNSGRLIAERDFIQGDFNTQNQTGDPPNQHNHGTYTWSALGGTSPGQLYGPAYGATFAIAKTEDVADEQPIEEDHWLAASEWADSLGAQVISSSLGYLDWYTYADMDGNTAVTTNAADIAASRNILVATAAGNEGTQDWFFIIAPADADSVLACGAVDDMNVIAEFSSHGPTFDGRIKPEVCARGVGTHCATPAGTNTYDDFSGTSMSTPLVGGAAALVLDAHPNWPAMRVRQVLMLTADTAANPDNNRGFGRIRVLDAINYSLVAVDPDAAPPLTTLLGVSPNPFSFPGTIELSVPAAGPVVFDVYGTSGREVARLGLGSLAAGPHRVAWDGRDLRGARLPAGVYLLHARGTGWDARTKLVVSR